MYLAFDPDNPADVSRARAILDGRPVSTLAEPEASTDHEDTVQAALGQLTARRRAQHGASVREFVLAALDQYPVQVSPRSGSGDVKINLTSNGRSVAYIASSARMVVWCPPQSADRYPDAQAMTDDFHLNIGYGVSIHLHGQSMVEQAIALLGEAIAGRS